MHQPTHITAPPLAPTIAPLGDDPRRVMDRLHNMGFRDVQLSAMQPGMRPRELDRSARRDLLANMRRRELKPAGVDLWIPAEHFTDPSQVDRAVSATVATLEMAGDLGRVPVSMTLPMAGEGLHEVMLTIRAAADRYGASIADHAVFTIDTDRPEHHEHFGIGMDPVAWLGAGHNPAQVVATHAADLICARLCDVSTTGMRVPIGAAGGRLDVAHYKVALSVARYDRAVVLDARQWVEPWRGIEQSVTAWR